MGKIEEQNNVRIYSETDISMLLVNIPYQKRVDFVKEIFKNCSPEQQDEFILCLKSYIKNNGSISKTADELFIHKNTLQYRLTKIKSLTGYDPRVLSEVMPLMMALYFSGFHDN